MMRVLQLIKTSDGAAWAARQCRELVGLGVDVHVALPDTEGLVMGLWAQSGATVHVVDTDLPVRRPWRVPARLRGLRQLVGVVRPDLVHSHFVGTTLTARAALRGVSVPRIFQVPGPLHLEHRLPRTVEVSSANSADTWIASSEAIRRRYVAAGIDPARIGVSYYGFDAHEPPAAGSLRARLSLPPEARIVGNVNLMYPPKRHLGQAVGIKAHEDVIDALAAVVCRRDDVVGVIVGGAWGGATWYEDVLRERAQAKAGDRIRFTGRLPYEEAVAVWADFELAVHVPTSENCGGVVEPLAAGVPVIASDVGGLPEVVVDGQTGWTVPVRDPGALAMAIHAALDDPEEALRRAREGQRLVATMFDVRRTSRTVHAIYEAVLEGGALPQPFDRRRWLAT